MIDAINMKETLIPVVGVVTDIRIDTPDVKTFRVVTPDGKKAFDHMPGQCAMLSIPGVGEAMFSITSSPTNTEYMEFSIKKCGCVTEWLHQAEAGQQITIRGPYGNPFPVDDVFAGKNLLFGIRSIIERDGIDTQALVRDGECPIFDKYDEYIPPELLRIAYAKDRLLADEILERFE